MAEQNTEKGTSTGLDVKLHPLVILNISDHWTRTMVSKNESQRVVGALLGTQTGRNVEIHTSFELIILEENGIETLDATYLEDKKGHYSAVFPTYELVGWYTTGKEMQISFHKVLMRYNESPLLLQMDTHPPEDCRTLPIWIHETVVQVVGDVPKYSFSQVPYMVESEESERISIDSVTHGAGTSSIVTPIKTYRSALQTLQERITVVREYLRGVKNGTHQGDHAILRDISSLCHKLPTQSSETFRKEYNQEFSDTLLITYLGALTRTCCSLSDLVERHTTTYERKISRRTW